MSFISTWGVVAQVQRKRAPVVLSTARSYHRKTATFSCSAHVATTKYPRVFVSSSEITWTAKTSTYFRAEQGGPSTEWIFLYPNWNVAVAAISDQGLWMSPATIWFKSWSLLPEFPSSDRSVREPWDDVEVAISGLTKEIKSTAARVRERAQRVADLAQAYRVKWRSQT